MAAVFASKCSCLLFTMIFCVGFVVASDFKSLDEEPLQPLVSVQRHDPDSCVATSSLNATHLLLMGVCSSLIFMFIGILPAFFIRTDKDEERFKKSILFECLLAFAAGNLLADVFLHLMPDVSSGDERQTVKNGLYIIMAFLLFLVIDKLTSLIPGFHAVGLLNQAANVLDNFAHGITVVGAFKVSTTFGLIALLATIIHEVPHEFGDFALLLRDGFTHQQAIKTQLATACAGAFGATLSYVAPHYFGDPLINCAQHMHEHGHTGSFLLPFTIGGFLYIALVGIVADMVKEENMKISLYQLISFCIGVFFIYVLVEIEHVMPSYLS